MKTTLKKNARGCADILATMACRNCDNESDPDKNFGWYVEHLWTNEDGKYTTCDADGNHSAFDGRGIARFYRDTEQSWKDYEAWVKVHLCDPLGNYYAKETKKVSEKWTATARLWIGASKHGLAVVEFRGRGKTWKPSEVPKEVSEYFFLKNTNGRHCIEGIASFSEVNSAGGAKRRGNKISADVEFTVPNKNYEKELIALINRKNP